MESSENEPPFKLIPFRKGKKWGFCNEEKEIIIECIYEEARVISKYLLEVRFKYNQVGIFKWDKNNYIGPILYNNWRITFFDGVAIIEKDGKYGFMDEFGNELVDCTLNYKTIKGFKEGLAIAEIKQNGEESETKISNHLKKEEFVPSFDEMMAEIGSNQDKTGKGFIDKNGHEIIPCTYEDAYSFSEGLAAIKMNSKWGFIDKKGKVVIPNLYEEVGSFKNGTATVCNNSKYSLIDYTGAAVLQKEHEHDYIGPFNEEIAVFRRNNKYGFIDCDKNETIQPIYDYACSFSDGLAFVESKGTPFFINKLGEKVISLFEVDRYFYLDRGIYSGFSEGFAQIIRNGKRGFIDKEGKEVIPCIYDFAYNFSEGLACVEIEDKLGFIDKSGGQIIPCNYDSFDIDFSCKDNVEPRWENNLLPVYKAYKSGELKEFSELIGYIDKFGVEYWEEIIENNNEGNSKEGNTNESFLTSEDMDDLPF